MEQINVENIDLDHRKWKWENLKPENIKSGFHYAYL
jgi:hypothetical protein